MTRFSFSSLRVRLMFLVLLGVVPALGFILYTGWSQRKAAFTMMQDNAIRVVRLAALEQDQVIDGTRQLLLALAQLPEIRNRDINNGPTILQKIQNENEPVYANFGLIDKGGEVIFSAVKLDGAVNLKDRQYFSRVLQTQGFSIGNYQVGRISGRASINFGFPVYDAQGRFSAVIFAAVDLEWLNRMIADAQLPADTNVFMLEQNGTILARYPRDQTLVGRRLPLDPVLAALAGASEGTLTATGADGIPRLFAFTGLGHKRELGGIYVVVGIPSRIAYADVNRAVLRNLVGLGLAVVLALLAAWFGGDAFILRRVRSLLGATRRLAGGDLNARTGLDYGMGELGELAQGFDEMAAALQTRAAQREQAQRELKGLNEVLELRVEERTQQLQEKTRQMEADLEMARELQEAFLPQQQAGSLRLVSANGHTLQFFHRYHPTGKVGGDFFDVLKLTEGRAGVFICDVMGQGIRAALVTAIVRGLVEELKPIAGCAGEFLTQINRGLCAVFRQTGTPMFASAFYLIADADHGRLHFANAGHPSPLHVRQNTCEVQPLHRDHQGIHTQREPALGLIDQFQYPTYEATIGHGDLIILYTDGLYEVEGADDEEFGRERLLGAVQRKSMLPPLLLFDELITEIQQFSATNEFSDDVCLIGMQLTQQGRASQDGAEPKTEA